MPKRKPKNGKVGVFALLEPEQKAALQELGRENQRSVGFLIREAVAQYLANLKKKP
jgi:predicted transcriptional regulator